MTNIDWSRVQDKLRAAAAALERGTAFSAADVRNVLKSRAQALAREPERDVMNGESVEIVQFRLADESYGIESSFVRAVLPLKAFTPLPGLPSFVLGVINMRGQIFPVIDLRKFFEMPEQGLSDLNRVIVLQGATIEFGILADAIVGIRSIPMNHIQSTLPTLTGVRQNYLRGVTQERLVILDAEKLLADKALTVHETAGA